MKIYYWRVYRVGGDPLIPTCVTSNDHYFDLFIKPGLNSLLVAAILFTSFRLNYAVSKRKLTLLKRQMERITSKTHSTVKTVEIGECDFTKSGKRLVIGQLLDTESTHPGKECGTSQRTCEKETINNQC